MATPGPDSPSGNRATQRALPENRRSKAHTVMLDQQNLAATRPASADPSLPLARALGQWPLAPKPQLGAKTSVEDLARELGLRLGDQSALTIRRIRRGKSYSFVRANGSRVRDARTIRRLHAMAVPPAYRDVRYSADPTSHLQAV